MPYDSDKTKEVVDALKDAVRGDHLRRAITLLRHADNGGGLRRDPGLVDSLRTAIGAEGARAIVKAFASDRCPYCTGGREKCGDCKGKGYYSETKVCVPCAGLGLARCPFCNGTSLAGYGFVPRGLQTAVMSARMAIAERTISEIAEPVDASDDSPRAIASRIVTLDRCRGMLANAVEQARQIETGSPSGRSVLTTAQRMSLEKSARELNGRAESLLRTLLAALASHYADRATSASAGSARLLAAHRAKVFSRIAKSKDLSDSALRTPRSLIRSRS